MYTLWVLATSLIVVSADVSLGYHYKVPDTLYGVPSYQIGGSGHNAGGASSGSSNTGFAFGSGTSGSGLSSGAGHGNTAFVGSSGNTGGYDSGYSTASTSSSGTGLNFNTHGTGGPGYNYNGVNTAGTGGTGSGFNYNGVGAGSTTQGAYHGTLGQTVQSGLDGYYQTGGASSGLNYHPTYPTGSGSHNQYQTSNQYHSAAVQNYQEYYNQIVQQPAQVYKHFYVHAAPEEPELLKPRQPIVLPPPQKHYKIIFIKTPAQPAPAPQIIPIQPQNEEKTIVYVLVKKPEDAQGVVVPKFEQKPPAKPEVFFIKYNNKHDSQKVISDIVSGYNKDGVATTFGGDFSGGKISGSSGGAATHSSASGVSGISSLADAPSENAVFDGSYAASSTSSTAGESFGGVLSQTENQSSGSFESQHTLVPAVGVTTGSSTSSGFENTFGTLGSGISSTASTFGSGLGYDASAISTSQGVPHETYGPPKFKEY